MADKQDDAAKNAPAGILDPSSGEVPGYTPPVLPWAHRLIFRLMLLVLISVVPLVALFVHTNLETKARQVEASADEMERLSRVVSSQTEQRFVAARSVLENIATSASIKGDADTKAALLRGVLAGNPEFTDLLLVGPDGKVKATAREGAVADAVALKRAFSTSEFAAGDFRVDSAARRLLIAVAFPVEPTNADLPTLVTGTLDLSDLHEFQRTFQLPADSTIHVIDARGSIVARFPGLAAEHTGQPHPLPSLSQGAGAAGAGAAAAGLDGVRRLYGHAPLETGGPAKGNMVVLGIPEAAVLDPIDASLRQNLLWTLVVAVLALIVARWVGQRMIVERVNSLILAMRRVAMTELKDFYARGRVCQDPSELGDLERSFDIMAHALVRRLEELNIREHAIEEAEHKLDDERDGVNKGVRD